MRAQEFLIEYQEPKSQRAHRGGIDLEAWQAGLHFQINATAHGRDLGRAVFDVQFQGKDTILVAQDLMILPEYRGQGIAAIMYDYAKELGYVVERSPEQTDAGRAFWDKNRGEQGLVWEAETQTATAKQVLAYINQTHHEPMTAKLTAAVRAHPQWELRQVPLRNLNIPDQDYEDPEQEPESDPYDRVMAVDPGHAGEVSQYIIDKRPIVIDADRYIIDGNHRAWAAMNLLNRDYIMAWVPVEHIAEITRRDFLRGAGALAGTAAIGSVQAQPDQDTTKIINSAAILWAICKKHYPNNSNTRALEQTVKRLWKNKSANAVAFNEEYTAMKERLADWETRDPAGYAKFVNRYMMNFAKIKADLETLPEMMI
jgi:GNAT superfamily N-acetyltransferase